MTHPDLLAGRDLPPLDPKETRRYGRHLTLPQVGLEGQRRLKASRVLLVGTGGLGSPAALYLAAAGVGTLGLVDFDTVDETNLQRQILFGEPDLGRSKVEAAEDRLRTLSPSVTIERHDTRLEASNVLDLVEAFDVVVDGSDNFPTRYLVNDACARARKPDVWGAILRFEGQVSVFWNGQGPCYRCLFPEPPPPGLVPSCAEGGVLGVLPGLVGTIQATEALKLLLGIGTPLIGRLLVIDALGTSFREVSLPACAEAPGCADSRDLVAFEAACRAEEPTPPVEAPGPVPLDVSVGELADWQRAGRDLVLLDVREPHEHAICHIEGSLLVPMREVPERLEGLDRDRLTVVHCHHGPRSSHVVAYLRQQGFARATNLTGGIDAWSLEIDPSVPRY